jgi:hypothetical protein
MPSQKVVFLVRPGQSDEKPGGYAMGHNISALVAELPVNLDAAAALDLPVFIEGNYAIVPLHYAHSDHWSEKLGIPVGSFSTLIHDSPTTAEFARRLGLQTFVLLNTNYFGSQGSQWATVYNGASRIMPATEGGINAALRMIGVVKAPDLDDFDTMALGKHRDFDDHFEK